MLWNHCFNTALHSGPSFYVLCSFFQSANFTTDTVATTGASAYQIRYIVYVDHLPWGFTALLIQGHASSCLMQVYVILCGILYSLQIVQAVILPGVLLFLDVSAQLSLRLEVASASKRVQSRLSQHSACSDSFAS